jgi:hypothetical protein
MGLRAYPDGRRQPVRSILATACNARPPSRASCVCIWLHDFFGCSPCINTDWFSCCAPHTSTGQPVLRCTMNRAMRHRHQLSKTGGRPCYPFQSHLATMERTLSIESIVQEVRAEIARLQQVLALLGGGTVRGHKAARVTTKPRRKMSAAGRRRIAAAQRARWAKIRAAKK